MSSPERDRQFVEAGLQELESYLLSKELYWPLHATTTDFTQLTPGALLLVCARMRGWGGAEAASLETQLDAVRSKWRSAWEAKASREVHARSEMWKDYLAEARQAPSEHAREYRHQVRLRAMLELLSRETSSSSDMVTELDAALRAIFAPGEFVWEAQLQSAFPHDRFWFLYGTIKS